MTECCDKAVKNIFNTHMDKNQEINFSIRVPSLER